MALLTLFRGQVAEVDMGPLQNLQIARVRSFVVGNPLMLPRSLVVHGHVRNGKDPADEIEANTILVFERSP